MLNCARRSVRQLLWVLLTTGVVAATTGAGCVSESGPAPGGRRATVVVFGDSLTPVADYKLEARRLGLDLTSYATGGTWMCGAHAKPQTDEGRWWPRIMRVITEDRPDFLILEYQAWANYQLRCGGRPQAFPFNRENPGQGWRVYLDMFRLAAAGRTHIVVVETPSAPPDMLAWVEPQAIMDRASRVMAARHPDDITFVRIRHLTTVNGRWSQFAPCLPADGVRCGPSYRASWPRGRVQLRASDRIHYWCPTGQGVCPASTPAGQRVAQRVMSEAKQR